MTDLLANIERLPSDPPSSDEGSTQPGYWLGPAAGHVHHWRVRAEAAEAIVAELRRRLARYRLRP